MDEIDTNVLIYKEVIGKTINKIENKDNEELFFYFSDNSCWRMYHYQDCCEHFSFSRELLFLDVQEHFDLEMYLSSKKRDQLTKTNLECFGIRCFSPPIPKH